MKLFIFSFLKHISLRWIVLAILVSFVWTVMYFPVLGEWYASRVYPLFSQILGRFSSWFPFSVGDCLIYGSIIGLVIYWICTLLKGRSWKRMLGRTAEYLVFLYSWFYLAWGLNYFRADFYSRTHISPVPYSADTFHSFLETYTDALNASFLPVEKLDTGLIAEKVKKGYTSIAPRFRMNRPSDYMRAKPMLFSSWMSGVGILGYMGPFFNEYNLNRDLLPVQYPFTYAHEMAHILGISSEAEANLYAYLVCTSSEIPEIRFSGYFSLLPYVLGNAYSLMGKEDFGKWLETLSPEVKNLYNRKTAYWESLYTPWVGELQDTVYNWFLKGNRIPSGKKNYSEVIGLLMALSSV